MPRSEAETRRDLIDPKLEAAGWMLQDRGALNLYAGRGVAVREFPLRNGYADYLLFVDRKAVGVVEAKPEGTPLNERDLGDEPAEVLLERIRAERRRRWEENLRAKGKDPANFTYEEPAAPDTSKLPELPEGWVWTIVDELCEVGTGATPLRGTKKYWENGTIPWITSGALNDPFIEKAEELITEDALVETNAKIFPSGTLLVAMYGEGRTRGLVSELKISAATNQACAALVFEGASAKCKNFIKLLFEKNYENIRMLSSGGVQPNLNLSIIRKTRIPLPSVDEQERIVTRIQSMTKEIDLIDTKVRKASCHLEQLEQAALSKAFMGGFC